MSIDESVRRDGGHAGLRVPLGGRLRVAHELVDGPLLGRELAAHGKGARDVGRVALVLGRRVHDDDVAGLHVAAIAHVMKLRAVDAAADDRAVRRTRAAESQEGALERRLDLVLLRRLAG